jgi:hypothetical protein
MRVGEAADLNLTKPAQLLQFDHVLLPFPLSAREYPALHTLIEIALEILQRGPASRGAAFAGLRLAARPLRGLAREPR